MITPTKRALVTGGTRGIGFDLCKMLLDKNYEVVFTGRTQQTVNEALRKYANPNIEGVVLDMTDPAMVSHIPRYCRFDVLIHNAGMLSRDGLHNMGESRLQKMFMVNAMAPMYLTKYCLPYMEQQRNGRILFFCPPYRIDRKTQRLTPYMQTKLAQTTFMRSLADMVDPRRDGSSGVTVGGFWTDFPIYTDALVKRGIGQRENYMDPGIISKMVGLMLEDQPYNIHGKVMVDRKYLLEKGVDPVKWSLGKNLKKLDELFLSK